MTFPRPEIVIRQATPEDAHVVRAMLLEAAAWVDAMGGTMWEAGELDAGQVEADVGTGEFFIAYVDHEPAGAVRFQLEDRLFWPDIRQDESAFVHRLVASRRFKGYGISTALLEWAADRARANGRRDLRLDCDAHRPKLRAIYERFGFQLDSYRQVGPYYVARYVYAL